MKVDIHFHTIFRDLPLLLEHNIFYRNIAHPEVINWFSYGHCGPEVEAQIKLHNFTSIIEKTHTKELNNVVSI
jgi:hypothetical protein